MARKPRKKVPDPQEKELAEFEQVMLLTGELEPYLKSYKMGECNLTLGWSMGAGWHLSIAHRLRYPTWDEIAHARYKLIPDLCYVGLILPPSDQYVAIHANCFHLFELSTLENPTIRAKPPEDYDEFSVGAKLKNIVAEQMKKIIDT